MPGPLTRRAWLQAAVVATVATGLLAGCGGSHPKSAIGIQVKVTSYASVGKARTSSYSLTCGPAGGTLPLAALVCTDIERHRQAMLAPSPARSVCSGNPFMPLVEVKVMRGPTRLPLSSFAGNPNCNWPGGAPLAVYYAASVNDAPMLSRVERLLRCEDNPMLLAKPTPWASVVACTRGLWTPASERDIRTAEGAPQLAPLSPSTLFPRDIGAIHCRIPAGGPAPRTLDGVCGVRLTGPPSSKLVHFVETWSSRGPAHRHTWTIRGSTLLSERGPVPPQLWR